MTNISIKLRHGQKYHCVVMYYSEEERTSCAQTFVTRPRTSSLSRSVLLLAPSLPPVAVMPIVADFCMVPVRNVFLRHHELYQLRERGALEEGPGKDPEFIRQGNNDLGYVQLHGGGVRQPLAHGCRAFFIAFLSPHFRVKPTHRLHAT